MMFTFKVFFKTRMSFSAKIVTKYIPSLFSKQHIIRIDVNESIVCRSIKTESRDTPVHVQNSVQRSERTDRKVLFERAELFEQFSSF